MTLYPGFSTEDIARMENSAIHMRGSTAYYYLMQCTGFGIHCIREWVFHLGVLHPNSVLGKDLIGYTYRQSEMGIDIRTHTL
jgi:hypothetical protein